MGNNDPSPNFSNFCYCLIRFLIFFCLGHDKLQNHLRGYENFIQQFSHTVPVMGDSRKQFQDFSSCLTIFGNYNGLKMGEIVLIIQYS